MRFFCWLGWHAWNIHHVFEPSFNAPIVERVTMHMECEYCPKSVRETWFDWNKELALLNE